MLLPSISDRWWQINHRMNYIFPKKYLISISSIGVHDKISFEQIICSTISLVSAVLSYNQITNLILSFTVSEFICASTKHTISQRDWSSPIFACNILKAVFLPIPVKTKVESQSVNAWTTRKDMQKVKPYFLHILWTTILRKLLAFPVLNHSSEHEKKDLIKWKHAKIKKSVSRDVIITCPIWLFETIYSAEMNMRLLASSWSLRNVSIFITLCSWKSFVKTSTSHIINLNSYYHSYPRISLRPTMSEIAITTSLWNTRLS